MTDHQDLLVMKDKSNLTLFYDSFRKDSLGVFTKKYSSLVAEEVSRLIDSHQFGVDVKPNEGNPLREATSIVCDKYDTDVSFSSILNCVIRIHPLPNCIAIDIEDISQLYKILFDSYNYLSPLYKAYDSDEIENILTILSSKKSVGNGLVFKLIDDSLPMLRPNTVKSSFPSLEERIIKISKSYLFKEKYGKPFASNRNEFVEFQQWSSSSEGLRIIDHIKSLVRAKISTEITQKMITSYSFVNIISFSPNGIAYEASRPIDHADVIEAYDGRIFIAVMDAGFIDDYKITISLADRQINFTQKGLHYGTVDDVPNVALDILKNCKTATVIEMRRSSTKKEIKARHDAIINDTTISESTMSAMRRWRMSAIKRIKGEQNERVSD